MVSGFLTSPCDHSRIFSGDASEIRIALKDSGSLGFSKKLKMSRIGLFLFLTTDEPKKTWGEKRERQGGKKGRRKRGAENFFRRKLWAPFSSPRRLHSLLLLSFFCCVLDATVA